MTEVEELLLLNGAIVLLIGLVAGVPYARVLDRNSAGAERAWRVAHSGLTMGGTLLIALSAAMSRIELGDTTEALVAYSFIVSGYAFAVALPFAGWLARRATLSSPATASSRLVTIGNLIGAVTSLIGAVVLVYGVASAA
jgi:hypothetical protein